MIKAALSWLLSFFGIDAKAQEIRSIFLDAQHSLVRIDSFKSKFVRTRSIDIYLPQDYISSRTYKVIYFQDGQNLFDSNVAFKHEPLLLHECLQRNAINDLIVVGIWNSPERFREYLPNELYQTLPKRDKKLIRREYGGIPIGEKYINFLIHELKPFIEKTYTVSTKPDDNYVAGISMGGLLSCYLALKYSDKFSAALCISTHWPLSVFHNYERIPNSYFEILERYLPSCRNSRFYFDCGTENIDGWYKKYQTKFDELFTGQLGVEKSNFLSLQFIGDTHAMADWKKRIDIPIKFLYRLD